MNLKSNWCANFFLFLILFLFLFLSWIFPKSLYALGVDEKLPLRILKLSETKQTLLINRGVEDGLVVGDHARFFLSSGIVARGVVVKTSPTRSVWSIYRLSMPDELELNKVLSLKITPPVKLTNDPSKALAREEVDLDAPSNIPLAEGADDLDTSKLSDEEKKDLKSLAQNLPDAVPYTSSKLWEWFGMFHLVSLTTHNSPSNFPGSDGSERNIDLQFGLEKYFYDQSRWFHRLSLFPLVQYTKQDGASIQGHTMGTSILGAGLGFNWHFLATPLAIGKLIVTAGGTYLYGKSNDKSDLYFALTGVSTLSSELEGNFNSFSIGTGLKYYFGHSFGIRCVLDYYQRSESYEIANISDKYTKSASGPRILIGLGYRW